MPRKARILVSNYPHHIVQRGHNRKAVFLADEDYQLYLENLKEWKVKLGIKLYAWCLMTNHMNIREAENKLFEEWRKKYAHHSFVIDGCPNPDVYLREDRKVVLVLKDGNLGEPEPNDTLDDRAYDQRHELEKTPTLWWNTIAKWCYCLKNSSETWGHVENAINDEDSIRTVLSHYCIVQLKKTWGGGSVENETLANVVLNDKSEIIRQLSIYEPSFIIACGNGEHLSVVFDCKDHKPLKTSTGVRFWNIKLENKDSVLVDYCHPSIRVGTKVKGVVAMGLSAAIQEIEQNSYKANQHGAL